MRVRVHSSTYHGLTTNLPREIMGYSDYAFSAANMHGSSMDGRRFPCSEEVGPGARGWGHVWRRWW